MIYIAFTLFLLIDSIGNIPYFLHLLKGVPPKRQHYIILREMLIALAIIITFNFIGDRFLSFLHISRSTVQIAGGVILFLISLKMIFPSKGEDNSFDSQRLGDPFIVPLAIPLIAGPAVLAAVMLYSHETSSYIMLPAILLAWGASLAVLILSPFLSKLLGKKGILACEKLMGLIMVLISVEMLLEGIQHFFHLQGA